MYVPFPAVSACSKSQFNKYPTKRPIPARPTVSPPTPSHQRSVSLHGTPQRNSIRENSNSAMIDFTRFFPIQFPQKFFPGFPQKIFPANATIARFAIFQKCCIASFARIPASHPNLMQPTLNPSSYQPAPFFPAGPVPIIKKYSDIPLFIPDPPVFLFAGSWFSGAGSLPVRAPDLGWVKDLPFNG